MLSIILDLNLENSVFIVIQINPPSKKSSTEPTKLLEDYSI